VGKVGKGGTVRTVDYIFFFRKGKKIINCEQDVLYTTEYSKYHMIILLRHFNDKVGREYFKTDNWE
jgi:hypothetical protein